MKETGAKGALEVLQDVQPMQKVPQSWSYGTFHQNNPIYMNLLVAQDQAQVVKEDPCARQPVSFCLWFEISEATQTTPSDG